MSDKKTSSNDNASQNTGNDLADIYNLIHEKMKGIPLNYDNDSLIRIINGLPQDHAKIIFLLMLHHHNLSSKSTNTFQSVIYGGVKPYGGIGVKYSLSNLPIPLIRIIIGYISYHKELLEIQKNKTK
ncbi:MAG: hypothetical protein Solumvirus3_15 [Solumvirus sp.]|uniref:Uncharacterized protein n=1 Tax=Solumvirus sp. TaxID=2487773 RepID=A0A3G5AKC5_9VIRU|nr:MAG: hypothetical protein Solumvirus3_15 [Solumvirus sp.]